MRIALITETFLPNVNGIVTTLCRLLEYAQSKGHEMLLFAPQESPAQYAGAQIIPLRGIPFPLYPDIRFTPPQPGIVPALRQFRPDLIHLAGLMVLGPAARFAARQLRIPAIATYHTESSSVQCSLRAWSAPRGGIFVPALDPQCLHPDPLSIINYSGGSPQARLPSPPPLGSGRRYGSLSSGATVARAAVCRDAGDLHRLS